jgi:hypothetical protein
MTPSSSIACTPCTVQAVALVWIKRTSRSAWIVDVAGGVYAVLYILGFIMLCALLHDGTVSLWFLWAIGTFPEAMQGQLGRWCCSNLSAHTQYPLAPTPQLPFALRVCALPSWDIAYVCALLSPCDLRLDPGHWLSGLRMDAAGCCAVRPGLHSHVRPC